MTNKQVLNKLLKLVEYVEKDTFREDDGRIAIINGVEYRKSDFNNFKRVIEWCRDIYGKNVKTSATYIENNKEYHRTIANLRYYKKKKVKKESDFVAIERLNRKLEKIKEKRNIEKIIKKQKAEDEHKKLVNDYIIKQEIEKEMEIYL